MPDFDHPFLSVRSACDGDQRYVVHGVLGSGSYGTVYDVYDRDLDRRVAIKVLDRRWVGDRREVDTFFDEARSTARLDHSAVVPIFDVQRDGVPWFSMKLIAGTTLEMAREQRSSALASPRAIALTLLRASEALAAAHRLGTVHCDVKPANLLLGEHGEVWVSDWGLASRTNESGGSIVGTPVYMAPEQIRGDRPSPAWDVYAIGVVLFGALYGRDPIPAEGGEDGRWWERKRSGVIDPPSGVRSRPVPPALRAIVDRCLMVDPLLRYRDAGKLADDLRAFLGDEPVSAHHEGLLARLARVARRHHRIAVFAGPLFLGVLLFGGMYAVERIKLHARWNVPVARGGDAGWETIRGSFATVSGAVVCTGWGGNELVLKRPCEGGVAVAYTAEIDPRYPPGDVSIALARSVRHKTGRDVLVDPIYAMVGAWDNTGTRIRLSDGTTVAMDPFRLEPGRKYEIRVELDAGRVSVDIDGRQVCAAKLDIPDGPRHVVLYGFHPGKSWGDVRVWERGMAERVPATAVGDAFMRSDPPDPRRAAAQYARVAASLEGEIADEARLRQGLALSLAGDEDGATQVWSLITSSEVADRAWAGGLRLRLAARHGEAAWTAWQRIRGRERPEVQIAWGALARNVGLLPGVAGAELEQMRTVLPNSHLVREARADLLLKSERWDEFEREIHDIQPQRSEALLHAGRATQALSEPGTPPSMRVQALVQLGLLQDVLAAKPAYPGMWAQSLIYAGRAAEVAAAPWADAQIRALAALAMGHDEEVARDPAADWHIRVRALLRLGRVTQALAEQPEDPDVLLMAGRAGDVLMRQPDGPVRRRALVVQAVLARQPVPSLGEPAYSSRTDLVLCEVVAPAIRAAAGDPQARARLLAAADDQRDARALRCAPLAAMVLGRGSAKALRDGDVALAHALAAEMAGNAIIRRAAWRAWLALPAYRRDPDDDFAVLMLARSRAVED